MTINDCERIQEIFAKHLTDTNSVETTIIGLLAEICKELKISNQTLE